MILLALHGEGILVTTTILERLTLDPNQFAAAAGANPSVVVTAGAGSGKTRALVGRYLHLLEQGYPLRSVAAITFTDKAAREMRTRARAEVEAWLASGQSAPQEIWEGARAELDSARISTIHSLCADVLRAHPAESGIDPAFGVLNEDVSAALRVEAVERALGRAAEDDSDLFDDYAENDLRQMLERAIQRPGGEQSTGGAPPFDEPRTLQIWSAAVAEWLGIRLSDPAWMSALAALTEVQSDAPEDKLESARQAVLARWDDATHAHARQDWDAALSALAALRKSVTVTGGRKDNWTAGDLATVREAMRGISEHYDEALAPLIAPSTSSGQRRGAGTRWSLDARIAKSLPALDQLAAYAQREYQQLKDERAALDFDDLERRAERLLTLNEIVRARWQADIRAVLVDEFQDTNERQRRIVYALAGFGEFNPAGRPAPAGQLFVVGDAKQSIYRFRGADVAVFRRVQEQIGASGGQSINLDTTYRAHGALVEVVNLLMAPIFSLGHERAGTADYRVPFAALRAHRPAPGASDRVRPPYVELSIGVGEDATAGRQIAAAALAQRLIGLHTQEGCAWGDMALLFRSSAGFGVYEEALEQAGIPYITIAGRGFYNRPEVRDLLNALAAVADPSDDLAVAGFLRSPAIGLSDADLFHLRVAEEGVKPRALMPALTAHASDSAAYQRAFDILSDVRALAGRASVAQVLKRLLDVTDYRAVLDAASRDGLAQAGRMRRNIDKLLADARASELTSLPEFLERIQVLRDVGARAGEAPVEAGGSAQLMTVHKAKGLEFPVVVVADAAYEHQGGPSGALFDDTLGLLPDLREDGARPVAWQLARLNQQARDEAESCRLLYVAVTRAREKLIVNGHVRRLQSGRLSWHGWLADLAQPLGLSETVLNDELPQPQSLPMSSEWAGLPVAVTLHPRIEISPAVAPAVAPIRGETFARAPAAWPDLVAPLPEVAALRAAGLAPAHESVLPARVWRVVPKSQRPTGPTWVVGALVHQALRHWCFPDARNVATFENFLRPFALDAGLTDDREIGAALHEAGRLLLRFSAHPLCAEIGRSERRHELPYTLPDDRGVIDVVYRAPEGWTVADFKTDELRSEADMQAAIQRDGYDRQIRRYVEALAGRLGGRPRALLVFLRVGGRVRVLDVES